MVSERDSGPFTFMDTVPTDVRYAVYKRDNHRCQNPFCQTPPEKQFITLHHCIFKSQYRGGDRDEEWNLIVLCGRCHRGIHKDGNRGLRQFCVEIALARRPFGSIPPTWTTGQYWRRKIKRSYVARALGRERRFVLTSAGLFPADKLDALSRLASCLRQVGTRHKLRSSASRVGCTPPPARVLRVQPSPTPMFECQVTIKCHTPDPVEKTYQYKAWKRHTCVNRAFREFLKQHPSKFLTDYEISVKVVGVPMRAVKVAENPVPSAPETPAPAQEPAIATSPFHSLFKKEAVGP